jgi:hypothetical protein
MKKATIQSPTPQEWKAATDYALSLGDKMQKASESPSRQECLMHSDSTQQGNEPSN